MKSGEIWLVKLSPSVGDEINKIMTSVILASDDFEALKLSVSVPITDQKKFLHDWHVKIIPTSGNGLRKPSVVDCYQIHCFSTERFVRKIGKLTPKELDDVRASLSIVLDLL